ncbi:MAG: hypothetical protein ABL886_02510 [Rhodoglobus sp.]
MTLYVADANGYLVDIASGGGWHDFITWVLTLKSSPVAVAFVRDGVTDEPRALAKELANVKFSNKSADSVRRGVVKAARRAEEHLLVSDGTDGDEEATGDDIAPWTEIDYSGTDDKDVKKLKKALPRTNKSVEPVKKVPSKNATSKSTGKAGKTRHGDPQDKKSGGDPKKKVKGKARRAVSSRPALS